jgi:hypothetical protein
MVNQIEFIRSQILQLTSVSTSLKSAADDLDKKLIEIEENLIQRRATGQGQDTVRWPPKLLGKINYLAGGLASGDFAPTKQQREVHALFKQQLTALRQQLDAVLNQDLMALNKLLTDSNIKTILATDSTDKHR